MSDGPLGSSFRDPSGFLFRRDGHLYRQINQSYRNDYDAFMGSGLYEDLVERKLLVQHEEIAVEPVTPEIAYKVIAPQLVSFISYPYEWSFSQLKHAAMATLRIQSLALEKDLSLKDASAYNIQFVDGGPVLIDTLSFERYKQDQPWVAYRQFCQHFLAPLALMAYRDPRLNDLLSVYIDGIPLEIASGLLPRRTRVRPGLLMHIHAHAASQRKHADKAQDQSKAKVGKRSLLGIVDNLRSTIRGLKWDPKGTEWADYYNDTNYTRAGIDHKRELVSRFLKSAEPEMVWDLGANNGPFSRLASEQGIFTLSFDIDPAAVEQNYRQCRKEAETRLLPLRADLTNPSPAIGWANAERMSLLERGPADLVMALALIHHLAISNNVPLDRVAEFFAAAGRQLIIEWVPKEDSQVQRLLATREDIFDNYTQKSFEAAFADHFHIEAVEPITDSSRLLYWMTPVR